MTPGVNTLDSHKSPDLCRPDTLSAYPSLTKQNLLSTYYVPGKAVGRHEALNCNTYISLLAPPTFFFFEV